jgi:hypothetical protein
VVGFGRRGYQTVAASAILGLALAPVLAIGCGGKDGDARPVAFVAGSAITKGELDAAVEHLREEAKREGRTPELGHPDSREARNHLLVLLVYRAELDAGAARLGIHVDEQQVEARLARSAPDGEEEDEDDPFARSTARAQLVYAAIYKRVTRGVRVRPSEVNRVLQAGRIPAEQRKAVRARLLAAKRNAAMRRWIVANDRRLAPRIRYEPGYAPVE